jgi:Pro-kumamolisin, activation domain/Bacterial Ig-like domain (group 1)
VLELVSDRWRRGIQLLLAVVSVSLCLWAPSAHAATGPSSSVRLSGENLPDLASLSTVRATSSQSRSQLTITVTLKRTRQGAFEHYLRAVQDRSSRLYGRFLTQAQQAARFGPSLSTYQRVKAWLASRGLRVVQGSSNRLSLTVRGTRAQVERAFQTPIRDTRTAAHSTYVNLRAPAIPRALASQVQSVMGLSDASSPVASPADQHLCEHQGSLASTPGNEAFKKKCGNLCRANAERALPGSYAELLWEILLLALPPVFSLANTAVNGANGVAGFTGYCLGAAAAQSNPGFGNWVSEHHKEIETAEKVFSWEPLARRTSRAAKAQASKLPSGAPALQRIGLLEFDGYDPTNVTNWLELEGIGAAAAKRLGEVNVNGGVPSPGAGESEVLLDIDTVMGAAPLSDYVVYEAPPSTSFVQMFQTMIDDGDTVISNSWSQCEDDTPLADAQAINSVLESAAANGITVLNGTGDDGSSCLDGSPDTIGVPADSPNATAVGGTSPTFGPGLTYGTESWWDEQEEEPAGGAGGFGVSRYFPRPGYQNAQTSSSMRSVPDLSFVADPHAGVSLCQEDAGGCFDEELWGGTSMSAPGVAALVADTDEELGHDVGDLNEALYPLAGTSAFHTATSMHSDFAHVGLGSPDFNAIYERLSGTSAGAVSATVSEAHAAGQPQADGSQEGTVRINLEDAKGLPIAGKQIELTATGGHAVISPAVVTTDATDGGAVFTVTDTEAEAVTFTAVDKTDGVTLAAHPKMTFQTPVAAGAEISAEPSTVEDDGTEAATISVYLLNSLGRPAAGKTVKLQEGGYAQVDSGGDGEPAEAVTNSDGYATFTATDEYEESVSFTATDVSDGNLPVPGTGTVTFEPEASSSSCSDAAPTAVNPFATSPWATGLAYNPQDLSVDGVTYLACSGAGQPAFDSSGNAYVADGVSGEIYALGPDGGEANSANALPDAHFAVGQLASLGFGKEGELYAGLATTNGSYEEPEVVQLNPSTGAIVRVVATAAQGLNDCPSAIAVDPLSGDIFVSDACTFGNVTELERISDPASEHPTVSAYTNELPYGGGLASADVAFAPDGTIYVAMAQGDRIAEVSGTNVPGKPIARTVETFPSPTYGVAVASVNSSGQATALDVTDSEGTLTRLVPTSPATSSPIATGGGNLGGIVPGPDGCMYTTDLDRVLRVTNGTACTGPSSDEPELSLSSSGPSPSATGNSVTYTATLENFPKAQGTAVRFVVSGANEQVKLVDAGSDGLATFTLKGALTGQDSVQAFTLGSGTSAHSRPLTQLWTAGRDTSYLSLNGSQAAGPLGDQATLRAGLSDVSTQPSTPIAGAQVTLSLAGQSCTGLSNTSGAVSCTITASGGIGLDTVTASYAGSASYTPSTATNVFEAGPVGLPSEATGTGSGVQGSPTTSSSPAGTLPVQPTAGPSSQPASLCGTVNVDLLDVYVSGGRLRLVGYANPRLSGQRVSISSVWNHRVVATAKVSSDGYFSASAKTPPANRGATAHYQARVGSLASPSLKLSRRLHVVSVARAGHGEVLITGQVGKPLADPPAKIVVTLRDSCQTSYRTVKAKVRLNRATGRFTALVPAPPSSAPGAVYRLRTEVRLSTHERRTFATYSLPRTVGH